MKYEMMSGGFMMFFLGLMAYYAIEGGKGNKNVKVKTKGIPYLESVTGNAGLVMVVLGGIMIAVAFMMPEGI